MAAMTPEEMLLHYHEAEAATVAIAFLRTFVVKESEVLEGILLDLGLEPWERRKIYDALSLRRQALEDGIQESGAYARYEAMARTLGLSPRLTPRTHPTPQVAERGA